MNITTYRECLLKDIAVWERAKAGKVYPTGCSTIQISATKGQLGYLKEPSEVEAKNVVIHITADDVDPQYLHIVLEKNMNQFCATYQTGLNIKEADIGLFPIQLHDYATQQDIVVALSTLDRESSITARELAHAKELKNTMLDKMFVG